MLTRIAVYGSLKKGKYNHPLLEDSEFIGKTTVFGTLYAVSSYPALVNEGNNEYEAELYDVDERTYMYIKGMEIGAGYEEMKINVDDHTVIVYYAGKQLEDYCKENKQVIETY